MGGKQSKSNVLISTWQLGHLDAQAITKACKNISIDDNQNGTQNSVMVLASAAGDLNTVRLLLQHGSNPIQQSNYLFYRRTPFHIALANRHEHVAFTMYASDPRVRAIVFNPDGLKKTPIKIAAQKQNYFALWLMLVHCHNFSADPLICLSDYKTGTKLSYAHYINHIRQALKECNNDLSKIPILFASFGLPCSVHVSAERQDYRYHSSNTQGLFGLWPNSLKYQDPVSFDSPPMLSAGTGHLCTGCTSHRCVSNECVLTCYLATVHQFRGFVVGKYLAGGGKLAPEHADALLADVDTFIGTSNQNNRQAQLTVLNSSTQSTVPAPLLLPPPVLLTQALSKSYVCTRERCVCTMSPTNPMCYIYPPLLSIPTIPLSHLTPGGFHREDCAARLIDAQHKTKNTQHLQSSVIAEKTNIHALDILQLHQNYIATVKTIFDITPKKKLAGTASTVHFAPDSDSPGFSVPHEFTLARHLDSTMPPQEARPKRYASPDGKPHFATITNPPLPRSQRNADRPPQFSDGSNPTTRDQWESVMLNNIRFHANRTALDSKFSSIVAGPKRDYITPLRFIEIPVHDTFTSMYPAGSESIRIHELTPPVLSSEFSSPAHLTAIHRGHRKSYPKLHQVTTAYSNFSSSPGAAYPSGAHDIAFDCYSNAANLSQTITPIAPPTKNAPQNFQKTHNQVCLCGAHTTNIQPIQLEATACNLNLDGRGLRITQEKEAAHHISHDGSLTSVLWAKFGPQTSIIYRPRHSQLNDKLLDYGFAVHSKHFEEICPPLNPTHDLSSSQNNRNMFHHAVISGKTKPNRLSDHHSPMGSLYSSLGSADPKACRADKDLGEIVISPTHHVTISIPVRSSAIIYMTSALYRLLQTKFPHYQLLAQWFAFTTQTAAAVQRIAQRRLAERMLTTEIHMLKVFTSDITQLVQCYEAAFEANPRGGDAGTVMKKQFQMYHAYIGLLEKYCVLRQFHLTKSHFTPGANIRSLIGNVVCSGASDARMYMVANPVPDLPVRFPGHHPGAQPAEVDKFPVSAIEAMLTLRDPAGSGTLTDQPTPLPPHFDLTAHVHESYEPPNGSITLRSYERALATAIKSFVPNWHAEMNDFATAFPRLAQHPNASILPELESYLAAKLKWEQRSPSDTTTAHPPIIAQPFTLPENFALDQFLVAVPPILRGFVQRIDGMVNLCKQRSALPKDQNPHRCNFRESIEILTMVKRQCIFLDNWLSVPPASIPPHFHTRVHVPAKNPANDAGQGGATTGSFTPFKPSTRYPASGATRPSVSEPAPAATPTPSSSTSSTPRQQGPPTQTYGGSEAPLHQPPISAINPEQYKVPTGYEFQTQEAPPSYEFATSPSQSLERRNTTFKYFSDDHDHLNRTTQPIYPKASPDHDEKSDTRSASHSPVQQQQPNQSYPTVVVHSVAAPQPTATTTTTTTTTVQSPGRPSVASTNPFDSADDDDDDDHVIKITTVAPSRPANPRSKRHSVEDSKDYFYEVVVADPSIILPMVDDPEYVALLGENGRLLLWLHDNQPDLWSTLTQNHPSLQSSIMKYNLALRRHR